MRSRTLVPGCLILALFFLGSACTGDEEAAPAEGDVWSDLFVAGADAEVFPDAASMAASADVVAIGHLQTFFDIRTFQGDAPEDKVYFGQARFSISELIDGGRMPEGDELTVEFLIPTSDLEAANASLEQFNNNAPDSDVLVFLRQTNKSNDAPTYRMINSLGLWVESPAGSLRAPLAFEEDVAPFLKESGGSEPVASVAELVDGSRRSPQE